jgi:hypothetical protein
VPAVARRDRYYLLRFVIGRSYLFKIKRLVFRKTAKLTQSIYGKRSSEAILDTLQNDKIVSRMATQSMTISTRARPIK